MLLMMMRLKEEVLLNISSKEIVVMLGKEERGKRR